AAPTAATASGPGQPSASATAPVTGAAPGSGATAPPEKGVGQINIASDEATLSVDGNATLKGNVEAHQGERQIRADQLQYDSKAGSTRGDGHIDYQHPLVHVAGAAGNYSTAAGAEFRDAQFNLRQRSGRGTAQDLALTPQGQIKLKEVTFTTCPLRDESWH